MENVEARARTIGAPPPVMVEVTALTRQRLGWKPKGPGMITDLKAMKY